MPATLWLIGMMGSGKTAVGRAVAAGRHCDFVDTDDVLEQQAGQSIAEIWAAEGEEDFRRREREMVASLAGRRAVVATGGGVVLDNGNVEVMRAGGTVIWLTAGPDELARRVGTGQGRPLLQPADVRRRLEEILEERRDRYAAAAHDVVDTEGRALAEIADEVSARWNES